MGRGARIGCGLVLVLFVGVLLGVGLLYVGQGRPRGSDRIGVVEVRGFIADPRPAVDALRDLRKDDGVKAVVLRVETPGGGVSPSQEIHDEVARTAAVKPVVVSMGAVAASGGYYLSVPATQIVANPGTATGSIGVIIQFKELHELLGKLGVKGDAVKSGPMKDAGSPFRPMRPEEKAFFQSLVDDIFSQFVDSVAKGRKMDRAKVLALADGRVYSGKQALALGLVDRLGGFWDAVSLAQSLAKLKGEPHLDNRGKKTGGVLRWLLGEDSKALSSLEEAASAPLRFVLPGW